MARNSFTGGVRATCDSFLSGLAPSAGISTHAKLETAARGVVPSLFEALEDRRLMSSITLSYGVLKVVGDNVYNNLSVATSGSNLVARTNNLTKYFASSSVSKIDIRGGSAGDKITIASNVYKPSVIQGFGGNDTIAGGGGRDWIYGNTGNDKIAGFASNDNLSGNDGNDSVYGGAGNDVADGNAGTDIVDYDGNGGLSNAVSTGTTQPNTGTTSGGSIALSGGVLRIYGKTGATNNLSASISGSNIVARNNSGSKTYAMGSVSRIEIYGSTGADRITISSGLPDHTLVKSYGGNDTIATGAGSDTVYAGTGNDFVAGYAGNDKLYGEDGNDSLYGGNGTDTISGGSGTNKIDHNGNGTTTAPPAPGSPPPSGGGSTPGAVDPDAPNPNAVISAIDTSVPAGHSIHVHGLGSSLGTGSPVNARYVWNFGDSSGRNNTLVGYNAAHVYDTAGTYKITLTVINAGGKVDTAATNVTVTAASRRKIYVSAAGSDSNSGSSDRPVRSVSRAIGLMGDNSEVLFRRGDTFGISRPMEVRGSNILIGAYGSGDRPEIKWTGSMPDQWEEIVDTFGVKDVTIQDLTLNTHFGGSDKVHVAGIRAGGSGIVIRRNEFLNVDDAINANGRPKGLIVQDNVAPLTTGLRGGFIWIDGSDVTVVGNTAANSTRENVVRVAANMVSSTSVPPERILIAKNNITNLDRSNVDRYDYLKGSIVVQKSKYVYVTGNTVRDGWITVGPLGNGDGTPDKGGRSHYVVVEGNKVNDTSIRIHHGAEHTMVRNNIVDHDGGQGFFVEAYNATYNRIVRNVTFANNTVVNHSDRGNFIEIGGDVDGLSLVNNLFVAPNLVVGAEHSAPVYVNGSSLGMFDQISNNVWGNPTKLGYAEGGINYVWPDWSNSSGYKTPSEWAAYGVVGTDYFSDVSISSSFAPSTSSVAASAGKSYAGVFTDFYGNSRPGSGGWTAGAVEV